MGVRITDWRCANPRCTAPVLAKAVRLESGWLERKCRKCGRVAHAGDERGDEATVELRCTPVTEHTHLLAVASANWRGTATIACDRCKTETNLTPASS